MKEDTGGETCVFTSSTMLMSDVNMLPDPVKLEALTVERVRVNKMKSERGRG